ncbi:hypothetical protein E2562_025571 [Oryza meyeriana var. granulata]|uniref:Uncharacterized protein n=1 Tax=Oryza meyeriana var. granulata TaxID=110450 RepID=A0A6G1FC68_9ORYZ|nr:hypothetical protein E2562_025571 [Oryza meyeriana var. granulata]
MGAPLVPHAELPVEARSRRRGGEDRGAHVGAIARVRMQAPLPSPRAHDTRRAIAPAVGGSVGTPSPRYGGRRGVAMWDPIGDR